MSSYRVNFGFFCDDGRREDNGKLIFIGAYGRDIIANAMPASFRLCLVLNITATEATEIPVKLRFKIGDEIVARGGLPIQLGEGTNFSVFPGIPIVVSQENVLSAEAQFGNDDWRTVASIKISRPSNASPPPPAQSPPAAPGS